MKVLLIYGFVCLVMLLLVIARVAGCMVDFKRDHPNARFRKSNIYTQISDTAKLILIFACPVVNAVVCFYCLFVVEEDLIMGIIKGKCEVT